MPEHTPLIVRTLEAGDLDAVTAMMERTLAAGELPGRTARDVRHLLDVLPGDPKATLVAATDEGAVGFAALDWQDLIVHPDHRRRGIGTRLVEAGLDAARAQGLAKLSLAPPPGSEAAVAFLARLGFAYDFSLWRLALPPEAAVPAAVFPGDVRARSYRADENVATYVDLVNAAFADHPSPYRISEERVRFVHGMPDFDPANTLLLAPAAEQERLIGVCRCRLRDEGDGGIGLIGVLPGWRGRGLGRALLGWGVGRLRELGATTISIVVDADNERALGLYERTGFVRAQDWPRWSKAVG